jgi:hypothetical protein
VVHTPRVGYSERQLLVAVAAKLLYQTKAQYLVSGEPLPAYAGILLADQVLIHQLRDVSVGIEDLTHLLQLLGFLKVQEKGWEKGKLCLVDLAQG